ncbi:MAG: tryptophan halogenase family protein [Steroidobacter sp.]
MNGSNQITSIAIVGGGTAGWMTASILARILAACGCNITVVESADIGTVGVGEATIPPIIDFLNLLSINQRDFVNHTQATYKLGIKFTGWQAPGHSYWHPFGTFGMDINARPFYHAWQKARADGLTPGFNDFSLCAALGDQNKFRFPDNGQNPVVNGLRYALHFDAGLVAKYLRAYSERLGVKRLERTVTSVRQRENGFIDELVFSDHSTLKADLYIDCSGFNGVLIEQTLHAGYIDWREYLPCDRAVAMQTSLVTPRPSFTESIAQRAGWRWRIPLQHRNGNGYVYSSEHISDADALDEFLTSVGESPLTEPRVLKFTGGRRKAFWKYNCIAIGLASGFLEPLESTSIHLVMSAVYKLLDHFPDKQFDQHNIDSYNNEITGEMERIRDFIIMHYCLTQREDTSFWRYCKSMQIPDSLAQRIELYRATGRIRHKSDDLFTDLSWFYILDGMGISPIGYDPLMDTLKTGQLNDMLGNISRAVHAAAMTAPSHDSYFNNSATQSIR